MPINYFESKCKTNSNANTFGLCDNPDPAKDPAYIDETNSSKWIGVVDNVNQKEVNFFALDNCLLIKRADGSKEKMCDGLLHYDNDLIFVELKDRHFSGWLGVGSAQLTETINTFKTNNTINYSKVEAYLCNKQRPVTTPNYMNVIAKFKNDTGFILFVKQTITIK